MTWQNEARSELQAIARKLQRHRWRRATARFHRGFTVLLCVVGAVLITLQLGFGLQSFIAWMIFFAMTTVAFLALLGVTWKDRGRPYEALLGWDKAIETQDLYSNAWLMLENLERSQDRAAMLHVRSAQKALPHAWTQWHAQQRTPWKGWVKPLLGFLSISILQFMLPSAALWPHRAPAETVAVNASLAQEVAQTLQKLAAEDLDLAEPSEDLAKSVQDAQSRLKQIAAALESERHPDALAAMEDLEATASKLEKPIQELHFQDTAWVSDEMILYLEAHAATRHFAVSVSRQDLRPALEATGSWLEIYQREVGAASQTLIPILKDMASHQDEHESSRWVGALLSKISTQLRQSLTQEAQGSLEELLDRMKQRLDREENRKKLQSLQESIRQEGGKLGGQSQSPEGGGPTDESEDSSSESVGGAENLPSLPPDALTAVPPQTLPLPEGKKELKSSEFDPQAAPPGQLPVTPSAATEKKRAKFFAPIPGMSEDQSKNLSQNFMVEGQRQDNTPGNGDAELGEGEMKSAVSQQIAELKSPSVASSGDSQFSTVDKTQLKRETSSLPEPQRSPSSERRRERAMDLSNIPISQRDMVRRYFLQRRQVPSR